ncbi:non-ribosomal peptide synthetase [Calothrix sp. PCC 7507]|uniref:non-ribosomal peptide synthetase n=1 Tax=Calothrix sp. PCC 7507 TaxID=99598 RepID=UPI00029EDAC4|nr:non-ribosomal peptide synthetase [Calothrix sp. PCC 7507]AFY33179.1 amino acid adenylation domain protein [Calothrix sp. PCC 7507]
MDINDATEIFWQQMFKDFTTPTLLGIGQFSSNSLSGKKQYTEEQLTISADVTAKLQAFVSKYQMSLDTILQGIWALLLSYYSGDEKVLLGIIESIANSAINVLPRAILVKPDASVLSWLQELQTEFEISLTQLQKWSNLPSGVLLFESCVVLGTQNVQTFEPLNFPVTVKAKLNTELILQINYDRSQFDQISITRILGHLQTLLVGVVTQPEQRISRLSLLTDAEQQQILVEWNNTKAEYPQNQCFHQLFTAQVERSPNATALIFADKQLTYQELNVKANQLAHYLQALGVGTETPVVICVERSFEMIVGLLGILKAGGVYVPIDPTYPFERLSFVLEDVQPPVILTQEHLLEDLPSHWAQVVCLDADWEAISQSSTENPENKLTAHNLAYIIHTSGSTGTPKGVLIEHQGLCNLVQAQIDIFDVQGDCGVLQFASSSFDASIWEIVMALGSGAKLCLGTSSSLLPGSDLIKLLREQAVTHVTLPPSALATLPNAELPDLRVVIAAGEACTQDLVTKWAVNQRFFNAYGPTESTVCATVVECQPNSGQPPIGRAIANTQTYILDRYLRPLPIGVIGELYIGGVGLARGYLHRPDLTAEKFIPNPFSQQPNARLYKTGDLARYRSDGMIEYVGRIDFQVKIRGFRIELGEIETVLSQHPQLQQTVVIAREDTADDKQIVAYIVPLPGSVPTNTELRNFLKSRLPGYMIPAAFVILDSLPLTPNGKVNRKVLPPPDILRPELAVNYVMPQTEVERTIATIWQQILKIEKVGIHDNFFDIGGDSLLMLKVHSQLSQIFAKDLSMLDLLKYTTINSLAEYLYQSEGAEIDYRPEKLTSGKAKLKQRLQKKALKSEK